MLNPFTLKFVSDLEENRYQEVQQAVVTRNLYNFSLYTMCFTILTLLEFALSNKYMYSIICGVLIILDPLLYKLIKRQPKYINYLLTFYQILIAGVFKLDNFISQDQQADGRFSWYLGFQCCILHFYVYLQGTHFIQQSIVIIVIFVVHLYGSDMTDAQGVINVLKFFFVFISMLGTKYTVVKLSKDEFIQNQQQQMFATILRDQVPSQALLIEFDKAVDQIQMVWCNRHLQNTFGLKDNCTMRTFLRKLETSINVNIETLIREQLNQPTDQKIVLFLYNQIEQQVLYEQETYNVQVRQTSSKQQSLCLFIIKKVVKYNTREFNNFLIYHFNYLVNSFLQVSSMGIQKSNKLCLQLHINQIRNACSLLKNIQEGQVQINYTTFISKLKTILDENNYILYFQVQSIHCDIEVLFQIIMNLIKIVVITNGNKLPNFKIKIVEEELINISIAIELKTSVIGKLMSIHKLQIKDQLHNLFSIMQQAFKHNQYHKVHPQVALLVVINQYLLSGMAPFNYITTLQEQNSIEFIIKLYK